MVFSSAVEFRIGGCNFNLHGAITDLLVVVDRHGCIHTEGGYDGIINSCITYRPNLILQYRILSHQVR